MVVLAPKNAIELEEMLEWSVNSGQIVSIRYPRGGTPQPNKLPHIRFKELSNECLTLLKKNVMYYFALQDQW